MSLLDGRGCSGLAIWSGFKHQKLPRVANANGTGNIVIKFLKKLFVLLEIATRGTRKARQPGGEAVQ